MAATTVSIDASRFNRLQMDRMADEDEDPTLREGIKYPGKHDVMLGRGGESTYHCGNISFRQLVEDHKTKYYTCPRAHKSRVVAEVVKKWRQLTPPGRFLTRTNPTDGDKSPWHDVGDGRALKKASHSLRDAVRCFSVEKKQRAAQAEREREGAAAVSAVGREGGCFGGGMIREEDEGPEISIAKLLQQQVTADTRKRSRGCGVPTPPGSSFFLSSSRVGGNKLTAELDARPTAHKKPPGSAFFLAKTRVGGTKLSELVAARENNKKKSFSMAPTTQTSTPFFAAAEEQQRPAKRQRVVYDEREESQEDCRREGGDRSSSSNQNDIDERLQQQRCCDERESGDGRDAACNDDGFQRSNIPSAISWDRSPPAEETFSFEPSFFGVGGNFSATSQKEQLQQPSTAVDRLPSPCGSADWFTAATEDLPVQASFSLPTADVLVSEVVVPSSSSSSSGSKENVTTTKSSTTSFGREVSPTHDEEISLGWFSDGGGPTEMASFTSAPIFNVDLGIHRPVAVQSSAGRE